LRDSFLAHVFSQLVPEDYDRVPARAQGGWWVVLCCQPVIPKGYGRGSGA
jgi:hypothetical protein